MNSELNKDQLLVKIVMLVVKNSLCSVDNLNTSLLTEEEAVLLDNLTELYKEKGGDEADIFDLEKIREACEKSMSENTN